MREVERSETRMPGVFSLWLLSLCTSKEKVTRRKGETLTPRHRCCGGKPAVNRRKPEQQVGWMTLYPSTTAVVARATVLLLGQIQLVIVLNKLAQDVVQGQFGGLLDGVFHGEGAVILPFLVLTRSRGQAARANFCLGVMPPRAIFGRS